MLAHPLILALIRSREKVRTEHDVVTLGED
jgi:hypothetical protein